jgi:hypothetical protein
MDRASFRFASFSSQNRLSSGPRPALTRTEGRSGKGACSHTRRPFRFSHESSRWLVGVRRPLHLPPWLVAERPAFCFVRRDRVR